MSKCGVCGKIFLSDGGLSKHKKEEHGGYFTTTPDKIKKNIDAHFVKKSYQKKIMFQ